MPESSKLTESPTTDAYDRFEKGAAFGITHTDTLAGIGGAPCTPGRDALSPRAGTEEKHAFTLGKLDRHPRSRPEIVRLLSALVQENQPPAKNRCRYRPGTNPDHG